MERCVYFCSKRTWNPERYVHSIVTLCIHYLCCMLLLVSYYICFVGSIKATVLIETILAAFEMDEILYELREHSAGLNGIIFRLYRQLSNKIPFSISRSLGLHFFVHQKVSKSKRPRLGRPTLHHNDVTIHASLCFAVDSNVSPARSMRDGRNECSYSDKE